MKDCIWLKPVLVAQSEFLDWTLDNHLRHAKFVALRDEKTRSEDIIEERVGEEDIKPRIRE
jgi:bifunctional non-homologous end joining protein LigD